MPLATTAAVALQKVDHLLVCLSLRSAHARLPLLIAHALHSSKSQRPEHGVFELPGVRFPSFAKVDNMGRPAHPGDFTLELVHLTPFYKVTHAAELDSVCTRAASSLPRNCNCSCT